MSSNQLSSIVLAAGFSSRMGQFKQLLRIGSMTVTEHAVNAFFSAGIKDVKLVTGYKSSELTDFLKHLDVTWVNNPLYKQGMFTSIQAGVRSLKVCDAFFILPVDIPLIKHQTIEHLIKAFTKAEDNIVYPVFQGKRGHPPLISYKFAQDILNYDGTGGLKRLLEQFEHNAFEIPVADQGILLDCDSPEDYKYLLKRFENREIPSVAECEELLTKVYPVEKQILLHCRRVAELAFFLGKKLKKTEKELGLITAAGLLHDIARKEPRHAEAGAALLDKLGYHKVAQVIISHMDIKPDDNDSDINAAQILYIADKYIDGSVVVDPEERFNKKMDKMQDTEIKEAIQIRLDNALRIRDRIEKAAGKSFESILKDFNRLSVELPEI